MGEYADMAMQEELDRDIHLLFEGTRSPYAKRQEWIDYRYKNPKKWLTLRGEEMHICDMTSSHILNAIAMLERSAHDYTDSEILKNLYKEVNSR
jgi:hypothetical protein